MQYILYEILTKKKPHQCLNSEPQNRRISPLEADRISKDGIASLYLIYNYPVIWKEQVVLVVGSRRREII
jgi:hypothetical protein